MTLHCLVTAIFLRDLTFQVPGTKGDLKATQNDDSALVVRPKVNEEVTFRAWAKIVLGAYYVLHSKM